MINIGIIGAQGNLGSKICNRLQEIKTSEINILSTTTRQDSKKVAEQADILILTIRQLDLASLFAEINPVLKKNILIISFIAHFPIEKYKSMTKASVIRAMADPWFNFSAYITADAQIPESLEFFFKKLSNFPSTLFTIDSEIDTFTIHFCYLFVVLFLNKLKKLKSTKDHLNYISKVFKIAPNKLLNCLPAGDPGDLMTLLATKGGITEMIGQLFEANMNISPEEIIEKVSEKFV